MSNENCNGEKHKNKKREHKIEQMVLDILEKPIYQADRKKKSEKMVEKQIMRHVESTLKKKFYKKMYAQFKKRLVKDTDLFLNGTSAYASVYSQTLQTIQSGGSVIFEYNQEHLNIEHLPNTSVLKVCKSGIYSFNLVSQFDQSLPQLAVFVNGNLETSTVTSSNSQTVTMTYLLKLRKNDLLTVRNNTSGQLNTYLNTAGLVVPPNNVECVLFKISNKRWKRNYSYSSSSSSCSSDSDSSWD